MPRPGPICAPPSSMKIWPVSIAALELARKATISATSSACVVRPAGVAEIRRSTVSGVAADTNAGDRTVPGDRQLIFWFNISALYPEIDVGLPGGETLFTLSGNAITPFMAALLGLALHESAYMAEIIRGGILAVGQGQSEAATAIGMRRLQVFWRITLPQALRVIVPATGNQVILMLKTTSLVSVIALPELLYSAQTIYARTFEVIPLLIVASIWYLTICSLLSVGQYFLEHKLGRGFRSTN